MSDLVELQCACVCTSLKQRTQGPTENAPTCLHLKGEENLIYIMKIKALKPYLSVTYEDLTRTRIQGTLLTDF